MCPTAYALTTYICAAFAKELNDDGSMLAVAINAVHVALLDAGVPMRHTFAAATVAVRQVPHLRPLPAQFSHSTPSVRLPAAHCPQARQFSAKLATERCVPYN